MSITTVRVACSTRERLKSQGRKGQTYDELINELIDATGNYTTKNNQIPFDRRTRGPYSGPTTKTDPTSPSPNQSEVVGYEPSIQGDGPKDG
jgi:hypothetical protein